MGWEGSTPGPQVRGQRHQEGSARGLGFCWVILRQVEDTKPRPVLDREMSRLISDRASRSPSCRRWGVIVGRVCSIKQQWPPWQMEPGTFGYFMVWTPPVHVPPCLFRSLVYGQLGASQPGSHCELQSCALFSALPPSPGPQCPSL